MNCLITLDDSRFNYSYKGFCSIVNQIIDISLEHYFKYKNYNCYIEDEQTSMFYDNIFKLNKAQNYYEGGVNFLNDLFSNKLTFYQTCNAHVVCNPADLRLRNKIFNNILELKPNEYQILKNKIKQFNVTDETLALQIRGTDKSKEIENINFDTILKKINQYFDVFKIKNIFLSTDDIKYVNFLRKEYGDMIVFDDTNEISLDGNPIHFKSDREKINREVLLSVYILSMCPHILYSFSNVSYLAMTIGINKFKSCMNLNLESSSMINF